MHSVILTLTKNQMIRGVCTLSANKININKQIVYR